MPHPLQSKNWGSLQNPLLRFTVARRHVSGEQPPEGDEDLEKDGKLFLVFDMKLTFRFLANVPSILGEFARFSCLAPRSWRLTKSADSRLDRKRQPTGEEVPRMAGLRTEANIAPAPNEKLLHEFTLSVAENLDRLQARVVGQNHAPLLNKYPSQTFHLFCYALGSDLPKKKGREEFARGTVQQVPNGSYIRHSTASQPTPTEFSACFGS